MNSNDFIAVRATTGTTMGVILSLPLSGVIAEHFGWEYVFYVTGGLGVLWGVAWIFLVSEYPAQNPRISKVRVKMHAKKF